MRTDDDIAIGATIRRARVAVQLRQEDLARVVGCSRELVSMWETGRCRPSHEQLQKIQSALLHARPAQARARVTA